MKSKLLKIMGLVFAISVVFTLCTLSASAVTTGWQQDENGAWFYYDQDGNVTTGWKQIKNVWYYFEEDGTMVSDCFYTMEDGKTYMFNENGAMLTGWISKKYVPLGDVYWRYANKSGVLSKGWEKLDGKWYYFDEDDFEMARGVVEVDGTKYLFNYDGNLVYGWYQKKVMDYKGTLQDGFWYYSDSKGVAQTGWKNINGKWYYFDPSEGFMYQGPTEIDGKLWNLSFDGNLVYGWYHLIYKYDGETFYGSWYYSDNKGILKTGWQYIDYKWYYFEAGYDGTRGEMLTGSQNIDDKLYVFDSNGALSYGWTYFLDRNHKNEIIGESWLYSDSKGIAKTDWQFIDGKWYYFDKNLGFMYLGSNKIKDESGNEKLYYFNSDGAWVKGANGWQHCTPYLKGEKITAEYGWSYLKNGTPLTGWQYIDYKWYYFEDGIMVTGAWLIKDSSTSKPVAYFFDKNGVWIKNVSGWFQDYYFYEVNKPVYMRDWLYVEKGKAVTGWKMISGKWYFFDDYGFMSQGVAEDPYTGKVYYFKEDGSMITKASWVRDFYFNPEKQKYEYDTYGWYYTNTDGTLKTGWLKIGSKEYYLDPKNGGRMAVGFVRIDDYYCYFNADGVFVGKEEVK